LSETIEYLEVMNKARKNGFSNIHRSATSARAVSTLVEWTASWDLVTTVASDHIAEPGQV